MTETARYWDSVAITWQKQQPKTLWRSYNDAINYRLFEHWLPTERVECILKTDLFDESLGDGLCPLVASRAKNIVGIDVSVLTAQTARSRHPLLRIKVANVRHLPFADNTFDVIISNSTLDHFKSEDEMVAALHELHRVLRVGGHLLITLDNLTNPVIALRNSLPFRCLKFLNIVPYYVGTTFGPHRLRNHLKQIGFEITDVSAVMHFPRILTMVITRISERYARREMQGYLLRLLIRFENLARWPTRFFTGYFVAARAIKRQDHL